MKIRALHPEFFLDPDLCELPYEARILFAGLWCHSDDYGRGRWLPKAIEGDVFPRDEVDIEALLGMLVEGGFIVRYQRPGKSGQDWYYFIPNWEQYQSPKYRAKTSIPEPPPESGSTVGPGQFGTESGTSQGQSSPEFSPVEEEEVLEEVLEEGEVLSADIQAQILEYTNGFRALRKRKKWPDFEAVLAEWSEILGVDGLARAVDHFNELAADYPDTPALLARACEKASANGTKPVYDDEPDWLKEARKL